MGYKNIEDKRAYDKKYRLEHLEEVRQKNKEWRKNNPDRVKENNKQWRLRNKDKIRESERIKSAKWRKNNPEQHKNNVHSRRLNIITQIWNYKQERGCAQCPEKDPRCLDFHHRDPSTKSFNISSGLSNKLSLETLMKEIEKCDLLCRNCHVKTYKRVYEFVH